MAAANIRDGDELDYLSDDFSDVFEQQDQSDGSSASTSQAQDPAGHTISVLSILLNEKIFSLEPNSTSKGKCLVCNTSYAYSEANSGSNLTQHLVCLDET